MSDLILARYDLPAFTLAGGGVSHSYDFSDNPPDAYVVRRGEVIMGLATEYEAALVMGERLAQLCGEPLVDYVLETMPQERRAT